jgi:hypothetical protein
MESHKFTKGPWVVPDQKWRSKLTVEARRGPDDLWIACPGSGGAMSYTDTVATLNWSGTPEWVANAHLIAAAPDMFEVLDSAPNIADYAAFGEYLTLQEAESFIDKYADWYKRRTAAIAKAKRE